MTKDERLMRIKKLFDELLQETDQLAEQLLQKEKTIADQAKETEILREKVRGFEGIVREVVAGARKLEAVITEPEHLKVPGEIVLEQGQEEAEVHDIDLDEIALDYDASENLEDDLDKIQEALDETEEKVEAQRKKRLYEKMFGQ